MRAIHLIAASGLLLAAMALIPSRPSSSPRSAHDAVARRAKSVPHLDLPISRGSAQSSGMPPAGPRNESSGNTRGTVSKSSVANVSESLPAIRLADNLRLPASLIPPADGEASISPAARLANQAITGVFYREVAENAMEKRKKRESKNELATRLTEIPDVQKQEEDSMLISPGEGVDQARHNADDIYRALFGDAAYNSRSMDAALEVQLPAGP